jgi:transposase
VLAELARGKLRKKIPALREALEGRFEALHALLIGAILAHLDFLDEQIERLSDAIEEQIAPFAAAVELLCSIPGVGRRSAELLIAEIGTDMSAFPSAAHLASWAGQCPGNDQSAGKRRSGRTRKGSEHLNAALKDAAMAALRTNDSYLQAPTGARRSGSATAARSARSSTRSSSPAGTCSPPASCTTTSAATTSPAATPSAPPSASSPSSSASATPSPWRPPEPQRDFPLRTASTRR